MKRILNMALVFALFLAAGVVHSQQINVPLADGEGELQRLDFAANTMIINGYLYHVRYCQDDVLVRGERMYQ